MAAEWLESTLGDACSAVDYGLTASAADHEDGPKFLRITDIVTGHIDWKTVPHVLADDKTVAKYKLHHNDIVLARTGASTGASAYVKTPPPAVFASYLVRLQAKPEYDPRFLSYYLKSDAFWEFIGGVLGDKSAQPNASASTMTKAPLRAPRDIEEQRAIAHILGTLDDKIELNRRMSETLEAMVRALFQSWFVDFDPVRAKAEGRDPGLPEHIADLFPDSFEDSELGDAPRGWRIATLGDEVDAIKGVSYKGSGLAAVATPLHNLNSIYEGGGYKYDGIKYYDGEYAPRHVVHPGEVIVANTEQGHHRLLIGYAAIVPSLFGEIGIASHHIFMVRPRPLSVVTPAFLCHLLNSSEMHDTVSRYANGTTVNMLPISGVQKPSIVVPPDALIAIFDRVATSGERRREQAVVESRTLAAIRDTLLPKLISGELRVEDAEKTIEAAL